MKMGSEKIEEHENIWIPMSDGCELSARMWMPVSAMTHPVPAIIEYIPYRKRDFSAIRDSSIHRFFSSHGFVCLRIDLRGSGDSDGVLKDEYLQQELDDGIEAIHWISTQSWCNGNVGSIGISWGGFNGLQLAALQPPELKAVIAVCASDNRYGDDIHYMGGCMLTDNLSWSSTMFAYNSCPPDPAISGERWREKWLERLEGSGLWLKNWLNHQRDDEYWKHASVKENYGKINCPVFIVSGWADGYSDVVFRVLENVKTPCRGLVGAWGHKYPQDGGLSPAIGFLSESIHWWNRWLKAEEADIENGSNSEPMLRAWMQHAVLPTEAKRPGHWIAEEEWPPKDIDEQIFLLNPNTIEINGEGPIRKEFRVNSPLSVGLFGGKWMSFGRAEDIPSDQREEDGGALVFESTPLKKPIEILGDPIVELVVASNKPIAQVVVRLSDVDPDGKATRVTFGVLNLCHRDSHESPSHLDIGKKYNVKVKLNRIGQRFTVGHRMRISISTSYWPMVWPAPEPAELTVVTGESTLRLPVRNPKASDRKLRRLPAKDGAVPLKTTLLEPANREWTVTHDMAANKTTVNVVNKDETRRIDDYNWEYGRKVSETYTYSNYLYSTLMGEVTAERYFRRDDWRASTVTKTVLSSSHTHFRIQATLDAYEGDTRIFSKSWDEKIARDHL